MAAGRSARSPPHPRAEFPIYSNRQILGVPIKRMNGIAARLHRRREEGAGSRCSQGRFMGFMKYAASRTALRRIRPLWPCQPWKHPSLAAAYFVFPVRRSVPSFLRPSRICPSRVSNSSAPRDVSLPSRSPGGFLPVALTACPRFPLGTTLLPFSLGAGALSLSLSGDLLGPVDLELSAGRPAALP